MGVDCNINLPANVRVHDVSKIMGLAAGLKGIMEDIGHHDAKACHVSGVGLDNSSVIGLVRISLNGKLVDGETSHYAHYHFEGNGGGRLLMPRSTAFWIAIGKKLVEFYGGKLVYQDHTPDVFYELPAKSDNLNCPEDGEEWQVFENRMFAVKPITQEELEECDQFAAYKISELKGG